MLALRRIQGMFEAESLFCGPHKGNLRLSPSSSARLEGAKAAADSMQPDFYGTNFQV